MTLTPLLRKFTLTAHVVSSVGWLGAVAVFLALALAGLNSGDTLLVRAAYLAMELIGWTVIVPLCIAALLTGLLQSLLTEWGLIRHYWIAVKLVMTIFATVVLLVHMQPIGRIAGVAEQTPLLGGDLGGLRIQVVADAGAALFVLLVATALSVYKPWGRTRYGLRKQREQRRLIATRIGGDTRAASPASDRDIHDDNHGKPRGTLINGTRWGLYALFGTIGLVLMFVVLHLTGGGMGGH